MKISIVAPIYNTGKFLPECIDSVLNQTFQDWELILVNDGSPDNSEEICKKYVKKDKRIRYFYQKNSGVSAARNLGISKAKGEYVFCMDSDDTLDSRFIETSYDVAIKNDSDIVVIGDWFACRLPRPAALPTCAMLLRKSFLDNHKNIRYPIGIQPCEDGLFSHQLLALTDKIAFNPMGIYNYREHENGNHIAINKSCEKVLKQIPQWFEILEKFYDKYDLWDKYGSHLLKFIEHEPFEFRFRSMPFSSDQKEFLFKIIHDFMNKHNLRKYRNRKLSKRFRLFLLASSYIKYEKYICIYNSIVKFLHTFKQRRPEKDNT